MLPASDPLPYQRAAAFALRLVIGVNFLLHGAARLPPERYEKFIGGTLDQFKNTFLPEWAVWAFAAVTPPVEVLVGFLLLAGLGTRWAAVLGLLWLAQLTFGMGLLENHGAMSIQLTHALTLYAVILSEPWNAWSVDGWLRGRNRRGWW